MDDGYGSADMVGSTELRGPEMPTRHMDVSRPGIVGALSKGPATTSTKMAEVPRECTELTTQTEVLHKVISMLEERLRPLTRNVEPSGDGARLAPDELSTQMGRFLSDRTGDVRGAVHRITRIMDLLEV